MGHVNDPFLVFLFIVVLDAVLYVLAYLLVRFLRRRKMKNEICCPHCHRSFAGDYSQMVEQSCVKAISVQTSCPHCRKHLFLIVQPEGHVLFLKNKNELLWVYELLF